jgi:hypothetical protein
MVAGDTTVEVDESNATVGPVTVDVNAATGPPTVTVCDTEFVKPLESVTVRMTVFDPAVEYVCAAGVAPVAVPPSP